MDMNEVIKNIVSKVAGSNGSHYPTTNMRNPTPISIGGSKAAPKQCYHELLELYVNPCLNCNTFCNCGYTYFPKHYPDVLVRSVDKHIVKLSGNLVRASSTLSSMVDNFRRKQLTPLVEKERGVGTTPSGTCSPICSVISSSANGVATLRIRDTAKKFSAYKMDKLAEHYSCPWEDLIEIDTNGRKVLTLFDLDSEQPTFGSSKDILTKVDYYVNMHLDDVDMRVETKKRSNEFRKTSPYQTPIFIHDEKEAEIRSVNTFQFEDWEEEFFNVNCGTFFDLHKANQELLVWDLYYAIEKWVFLGRGFPQLMINGYYDLFNDPDFDQNDKKNVFGLYMVRYPNPYRRSWHMRSRLNISHFNKVNFTPRWWAVSDQRIKGKVVGF